jgi:hypothetical protein
MHEIINNQHYYLTVTPITEQINRGGNLNDFLIAVRIMMPSNSRQEEGSIGETVFLSLLSSFLPSFVSFSFADRNKINDVSKPNDDVVQ